MNNEFEFLDVLTILSFVISLQNLELNQKQVTNLEQHLAQQDHILIEEQNAMLQTIIEQNKEIIDILRRFEKGEDKNGPQL